MTPLLCPRCRTALAAESRDGARFERCATCRGLAVNAALLRRFAPPDRVRALWVNLPEGKPGGPCPSCARPLVDTPLLADGRTLTLGVCRPCQLLWFDATAFAAFSPGRQAPAPRPRALSPQAAEAIALERIAAREAHERDLDDAWIAVSVLDVLLSFGF